MLRTLNEFSLLLAWISIIQVVIFNFQMYLVWGARSSADPC